MGVSTPGIEGAGLVPSLKLAAGFTGPGSKEEKSRAREVKKKKRGPNLQTAPKPQHNLCQIVCLPDQSLRPGPLANEFHDQHETDSEPPRRARGTRRHGTLHQQGTGPEIGRIFLSVNLLLQL